jgi:hypothetical protein
MEDRYAKLPGWESCKFWKTQSRITVLGGVSRNGPPLGGKSVAKFRLMHVMCR